MHPPNGIRGNAGPTHTQIATTTERSIRSSSWWVRARAPACVCSEVRCAALALSPLSPVGSVGSGGGGQTHMEPVRVCARARVYVVAVDVHLRCSGTAGAVCLGASADCCTDLEAGVPEF